MFKSPFARYLCFENTKARVGVRNDKDRILVNPQWADVEDAVRRLDGVNRSYVILAATQDSTVDGMFVVGGGKDGLCVCTFYDGDEYHLIDSGCTDTGTVQVLIGEASLCQKQELVGLDAALAAARMYWERGERDEASTWTTPML